MTSKNIRALATNLKLHREQQNLTQKEFADKAGVSVNYYARVERADARPSLDTIEKLVKALGVKSSEILPF